MKRRKDGRWQKKITLPNGKSKMLYSSASSERMAIKEFNDMMLSMKQEATKSHMFKAIADEWVADYRTKVSDINYRKATKSSYEKVLAHFSENNIESITATDIHKYINKLIKQGYSQKTIATHKSVLNMIFTFAILSGHIDSNPVQIITLPNNLPKTPRKMPTDEEINIVNSHYNGFAFLPYFLLNTGLRKSEALALEYEDIDFENKSIRINKKIVYDGNKPIVEYKTKTINSLRSVILLDRVAEKLPKDKKGIIFCNENNSYLTSIQFTRRWDKWKKEYGINVTAHQLRHGFATMLYEAGIDIKDAQDLMGHSDIKTTQSIYTHIRDKRREETAQKLNEFHF